MSLQNGTDAALDRSPSGGYREDIAWREGKLTESTVRSLNGGTAKLRYGTTTKELKLRKGESYRMTDEVIK